MWAPGQNLVEGHVLRTYNAAGAATETNNLPGNDVQRRRQPEHDPVGDAEAEAAFPASPPTPSSPARTCSTPPAARSAGKTSTASPGAASAATPAQPGRHTGRRRSPTAWPCGGRSRRAARPCWRPTDDRDNSAADFAAVFPAPRPNSVAPTEHACGSFGGARPGRRLGRPADDPQAQAAEEDHGPHPDLPLLLRRGKAPPSNASSTASRSGPAARPSRPQARASASHTFKVRAAIDSATWSTPRPASFAFRVVKKPASSRSASGR